MAAVLSFCVQSVSYAVSKNNVAAHLMFMWEANLRGSNKIKQDFKSSLKHNDNLGEKSWNIGSFSVSVLFFTFCLSF